MSEPALPVLYLNPLVHQGKTFIKCWHKPSRVISQLLKTAPWIKFSQTYKCYVMAHTAQVLQQTHSHFTGIATVNTRYLCRPPRLRPPEGASILAGSHPSEPLTKLADLPVVRLAPLLYQDQTLVGISHRYNQQIYSRLKHSQVCRWLPDSKCFTLSTESQHLHTLLDELKGVAQLWVCQTLQIKDMHLLKRFWEQNYQQAPGFLTCPLAYLEQLFLLNYSLNTIRTYHSLLLRFLNGHQHQGLDKINAFTEADINQYHRGMVQSKKYSCSFVNQSINAVKFYYQRVQGRAELNLNNVERPEKPHTLPKVLSRQEVARILQASENQKHR